MTHAELVALIAEELSGMHDADYTPVIRTAARIADSIMETLATHPDAQPSNENPHAGELRLVHR